MLVTTIPMTAGKFVKMVNDGRVELDNPIQRRGGQWTTYSKSLLIHSMVDGFLVPPVYLQRFVNDSEDTKQKSKYTYTLIDGRQRITNIADFINGEYKLHADTPSYKNEDGEVIEIAGKYYDELDDETKDTIRNFNFSTYNVEGTDDEIEELFYRLNNGVALNKNQQTRAKMGTRNAKFIQSILDGDLFTKHASFSPAAIRRADDQAALLQGMALLRGYDYKSFSASDMEKFAIEIKDDYSDDEMKELELIIGYLEDAFYDEESKNKNVKKINIPMLILVAKEAMENKIDVVDFKEWFNDFFENRYNSSKYQFNCGAGSVKKQKVNKRIEILTNDFRNTFAEQLEKAKQKTKAENVEDDIKDIEEEIATTNESSEVVDDTEDVNLGDEFSDLYDFVSEIANME